MKITKKQVKELKNTLHKERVDYLLKEWFPDVFKEKLEVGKWYKRGKELAVWNGGENTYGFSCTGLWVSDMFFSTNNILPATNEEVEAALIAEAKKRGFKEGVISVDVWNRLSYDQIKLEDDGRGFYIFETGGLWYGNNMLMSEGKWAEIIEEPKDITVKSCHTCPFINNDNQDGYNACNLRQSILDIPKTGVHRLCPLKDNLITVSL